MVLNLMHWLAGIKEYSGPVNHKPKVDTPAVVFEILNENRKMEAAVSRDDMLSLSYFYADDAVITGTGSQSEGREEIDAYWFALKGRCISWELENVEIIPSGGNMACQRGVSHLRYYDNTGKEVLSVVRFTLVWQKNEAGKWKILVDHYTRP